MRWLSIGPLLEYDDGQPIIDFLKNSIGMNREEIMVSNTDKIGNVRGTGFDIDTSSSTVVIAGITFELKVSTANCRTNA